MLRLHRQLSKQECFQPQLGRVARLAKASGLESVSIAGALKIDSRKIRRLDGATLPDALRALFEAAKAPVALIIDETQRQDLQPVDTPALLAAFQSFGSRPQFFMEALGQALRLLAALTTRFEAAMAGSSSAWRAGTWPPS